MVCAGSQLFVHGGRNNFVLEDMFVLDLAKKEWTDIAPGAHTPPPRHAHLMTVHADKLYMYGGYDELGAWSDAMFCLPVPYDQPFTSARWACLGPPVFNGPNVQTRLQKICASCAGFRTVVNSDTSWLRQIEFACAA